MSLWCPSAACTDALRVFTRDIPEREAVEYAHQVGVDLLGLSTLSDCINTLLAF
ncbi:MAG: hypothetical protein ACSLEN_05870 [Candidatus Malihini olakiniferum]